MVSSGRPAPPNFFVTSWPSMVPTVRLMLRIATWARTGWASVAESAASASAASLISSLSSAFSRPWSCSMTWWRGAPSGSSGT